MIVRSARKSRTCWAPSGWLPSAAGGRAPGHPPRRWACMMRAASSSLPPAAMCANQGGSPSAPGSPGLQHYKTQHALGTKAALLRAFPVTLHVSSHRMCNPLAVHLWKPSLSELCPACQAVLNRMTYLPKGPLPAACTSGACAAFPPAGRVNRLGGRFPHPLPPTRDPGGASPEEGRAPGVLPGRCGTETAWPNRRRPPAALPSSAGRGSAEAGRCRGLNSWGWPLGRPLAPAWRPL